MSGTPWSWSPSGSDDYVRTYRALMNTLAKKFRAMVSGGDVLKAADEEEAIEEVKVYASRFGNQAPEVLQDAADRLLVTTKVFYGRLAMDPGVSPSPVAPAVAEVDPLEDKVVEAAPRYVIVRSKRGAMLRLHRAGGCWRAQTLTFASYELCDLDPVPRALYSHYCHACWPRAAPTAKDTDDLEDESTDSDSSTAGTRDSTGE